MERINRTLNRLSNSPGFQQRYEDLKTEILANPAIQAFLKEHQGQVTNQMIEKNLNKLYEFMTQTKQCSNCNGLDQCQNMMQGYEPVLSVERGDIDIHYRPCPTKIVYDERKKSEQLIKSIYVPKDILHASFGNYALDSDGRTDAFVYAEQFTSTYMEGGQMKGLYLYGKFGVGKSYLLGAIANQLAEKGASSLIVYVPEFLREMKQSLGDQTLNEKLDAVKKANILMLDDIGAEAMSSWTRDEVLGSILQYRMQDQLPTFFSSNFDFDGLEHHLTYSQRGEEEKLKAARIMERIKYLSHPIELDGPNRRHS